MVNMIIDDTLAQALMWLVTFSFGIGIVGLVKWLKDKANEDKQVSKTLKRLDKR